MQQEAASCGGTRCSWSTVLCPREDFLEVQNWQRVRESNLYFQRKIRQSITRRTGPSGD